MQSARASLAQAQAQRDQAALTRERMTVRAPIDGVVIELLASPGSVLHFGHSEPTSQVALLYEPSKLQVRADIPLADAAAVGAGQPARITVDLLPDTEFTGEVLRFVHRADLLDREVLGVDHHGVWAKKTRVHGVNASRERVKAALF